MFTPFAFIQPFVVAQGPVPTALQYLLIGGDFTLYNSPTTTRLIKLDSTGNLDGSLNMGTGFNGSSLHIYQQPDGKYVIPGNYTNYSGSSRNRIVRINQDGTYDDSFNIGTGASAGANAIVWDASPDTDNTNIIVGNFTAYSGSSVNRITKLNTSGARDTSFNVGTGFGNQAYRIVRQTDGKVIVGGIFASYSGSTVNRIVRLNTNGTIDTSFNIGTGFPNASSQVLDILIQTDGKILVVGAALSPYSGSTGASTVIRINSDGTKDTTFNPGTGFNQNATALATESSGKILVAGNFTSYSGSSVNRLVRLNTDGTIDTSLNIGTGFDTFTASPGNSQLYVDSNNNIYALSTFTSYSGSTDARYIVKIQPSGAIDTTFVTATASFNDSARGFNVNGFAYCLIPSGSSFIIGGAFTSYKVPRIERTVMIDSQGNVSSSFNMGGTGFDTTIYTYATQSDGKIIAGGNFTSYSGSSVSRLIRLNRNGTYDTSFNVGAGFNSNVMDVKIQSDDKVIVVGQFTTYSGSAVNGIVRLNTNGTRDTSFNVGNGLQTSAIGNNCKIQSDGKVVVVGSFATYSGSARANIARINTDGTLDTTFNIGTGLNGTPQAVIIQSDGKIITGGAFTSYSGSSVNRIVRINTNGTYDTSFNVGTGLAAGVYSFALQSDNKIICANGSSTYSGSTNRYIIRINTDGTLDTGFNANASAFLTSQGPSWNGLAVDSSGSIYWGNNFTTFSGSFVPNRIVKLNTNGSVDETFNQNYTNVVASSGKGANAIVRAVLLL
jgi:uncharacterized delta-60 repeat protein